MLDPVALNRTLELSQKGGISLLAKMVGHYLARTPELLTELERSLERKESEGVRVAAHSLKSSSLSMGVVRLAQLASDVERDHADLALVQQHSQHIASTFEEAKRLCRVS